MPIKEIIPKCFVCGKYLRPNETYKVGDFREQDKPFCCKDCLDVGVEKARNLEYWRHKTESSDS
ncbi:MAG: hypothetical protein E6K83_01045 [Thaumarchaeota archaeon]|nr:MAG: hypothetical protein E6K83_01045 [Nitrososphaerota archaeon]